MSKLDDTYKKIIETLEKNIKDKESLNLAKEQNDNVVKDVFETYDTILEKYEEDIHNLVQINVEYEKRIDDLDKRLKSIEKLIEMEDYDIFVCCPYCGFEFQTEYNEEIEEIPCPECGKLIEIDWSDDDDEDDDN